MILVLIFIIGLIFGSFLNVVIYRLKNDLPISGRSFCPRCRAQLKWSDLIPVFSFLWLRGRCRYCHKKISWQYPIVEILSGFIWVGVFYKVFGFNPLLFPPLLIRGGLGGLDFIYYIFILSALLVIAVYDFKWKIIPDKIVYPAIAVALVFNLFNALTPPDLPLSGEEIFSPLDKGGLGGVLLTASIAFLFFFLIYFFSKGKAMGLGDAKLAFLIGLFLSPLLAITTFTLSFVIGAVFGIILIVLGKIFPRYGKWKMKSQIAFGPFLVLGAFLAFFFSDFISKFLYF